MSRGRRTARWSALGLVLILLCLVRLSAAGEGPFYVSPSGDDNNPGTFDQPSRTLEKARDTVRALGPTSPGDVTVLLRRGDPHANGPLHTGRSGQRPQRLQHHL